MRHIYFILGKYVALLISPKFKKKILIWTIRSCKVVNAIPNNLLFCHSEKANFVDYRSFYITRVNLTCLFPYQVLQLSCSTSNLYFFDEGRIT